MKTEILRAILLLIPLVPVIPFSASAQNAQDTEVTLTVLFDNFTEEEGLQTGWGFAVLLETGDHTVLFDSGADGEVLLHNMRALGKDPMEIEAIVISHAHGDHTGGMGALLELGIQPTLFTLSAFPPEAVRAFAGSLETVQATPGQEIFPGILTTGVVGEEIPEQALVLDTPQGIVVLTGCAHPGPMAMANRGAEVAGRPLYGIFGGFHLIQTPEEEVDAIIQSFQDHGVVKAGATHCTGPQAMEAFREAYEGDYVPLGVGRVIRLPLT